MQSSRLGIVALIAAGALWAQLALIPLVAARGAATAVPLALAVLALVTPAAGLALARTRPAGGVAVILAGFPGALALFALAAGQRPLARFDVPARVIAAGTALAFVAATITWARSLQPSCAITVTPMDPVPERAPPPRLRGPAFGLLALQAAFLATVAPALVTAHGAATRADRLGGEGLVRAREALTAAGGLAIALALVLGPGSALLRGRAVQRRRSIRGLAFLVWSVAVLGLKMLLDRLR
jgi:hypothetical protein